MQEKWQVKKKRFCLTRIFDIIEQDPLTTFCGTMQLSKRANYCVAYLNLRGWTKPLFLAGAALAAASGVSE